MFAKDRPVNFAFYYEENFRDAVGIRSTSTSLENTQAADIRTITPVGPSSQVTWAMTGHNAYFQKVMGTLFNMDRMVGDQFAAGLSALKNLAERAST